MISVSTETQADLSDLIATISNNLNPDLRDLTQYVRQLEFPVYYNSDNALDTARHLAQYVDLPLIAAIQKINDYKEIEAPLADLKDSSLRSMSSILDALAKRALTRSVQSGGAYVNLFHVFYDEFGPKRNVARNTFYAYRSALTRYALKRIADLAPHLPANIDKERAEKSFIRAIADEGQSHSSRPSAPNVDNPGAGQPTAFLSTAPHPLTSALYSAASFTRTELDDKLSVYPWFASKRLPRSGQVPPTLTNLEVIELAECLRFICHYDGEQIPTLTEAFACLDFRISRGLALSNLSRAIRAWHQGEPVDESPEE